MTDGGGLLAQLYSLRRALKGWLWVIGLWVGLSVTFVITQLVKLTLFQRQKELDIWISVGANELLIIGPLMIESAIQTGLGAWVALELVNQALSFITSGGAGTLRLLDLELSPLPQWGQALFMISAALLGALASFRVARTSLRLGR
jgi:cell division transport system permease protein